MFEEKILFVDDDSNILDGFRRYLRKYFRVETANNSSACLDLLYQGNEYALIISDMRMPGMNGIELLGKVQAMSPDTVRMILTGFADVQTAISAVNEGNIFRFMTKPINQDTLIKMITAGLEQYRLIRTEKELLEQTLRGSIQVMAEILSIVNPPAFSRSTRVHKIVRKLAQKLNLADLWQFEVAAMLSQIGCVALPASLLEKVYSQRILSNKEYEMYNQHPVTARKLLIQIPRMDVVSQIIERQTVHYSDYPDIHTCSDFEKRIMLGSQILSVVLAFDELLSRGMSKSGAMNVLLRKEREFNPKIIRLLESINIGHGDNPIRLVAVADITEDMVAAEDIFTVDGKMLVAIGTEMSAPMIERLQNHAREVGIREPVKIRIPDEDEEDSTEKSGKK